MRNIDVLPVYRVWNFSTKRVNLKFFPDAAGVERINLGYGYEAIAVERE